MRRACTENVLAGLAHLIPPNSGIFFADSGEQIYGAEVAGGFDSSLDLGIAGPAGLLVVAGPVVQVIFCWEWLSAFRHYVTDVWRRTLRRRAQRVGHEIGFLNP